MKDKYADLNAEIQDSNVEKETISDPPEQAIAKIELESVEVTVWTGTVFLGDQAIQVLLDTATDLVAFNSDECEDC